MAALVVYLTLAFCLSFSEAQYLTSFLSGNLLYNHQPYFSRYQPFYQPQYQPLFRPHYDSSFFRQTYPFFGSSFLPSGLPNDVTFPTFNVTTPSSNENAEETTSPIDIFEVTTPASIPKLEEDNLNNNGTLVPEFSDFFKQTSLGVLPVGYSPYNQILGSNPLYYSNIYDNKVVLPNRPVYNNYLMDLIYRNSFNNAYGLTGFRPFYYNPYLKNLNGTRCSHNSTESESKSCDSELSASTKTTLPLSDTSSNNGGLLDLISQLYKPDANLVIFNTKDVPMRWSSDEEINLLEPQPQVKTETDKNKKDTKTEEEPFYKIYKDIMFLNKSYLSTFSPYFHKH